jgi:alkylation response protein AidB-like acyl-CoA dehydrogenase
VRRDTCGNCPLVTITQIHEGTNQIQRMVMARQVLKGS